jgi:hypothetical protein
MITYCDSVVVFSEEVIKKSAKIIHVDVLRTDSLGYWHAWFCDRKLFANTVGGLDS